MDIVDSDFYEKFKKLQAKYPTSNQAPLSELKELLQEYNKLDMVHGLDWMHDQTGNLLRKLIELKERSN